jgi:hypothetical protein
MKIIHMPFAFALFFSVLICSGYVLILSSLHNIPEDKKNTVEKDVFIKVSEA